MKLIYKSTISILFLLLISTIKVEAQNQQKDSLQTYPDIYGLTISVDALDLSKNLWDKNYKGINTAWDYRINKTLYAAVDAGYEHLLTNDDRLSYQTDGLFLKLGANKNYHNNWLSMNNQIYVGARYAVAVFSQELIDYKILTQGGYLPEYQVETNTISRNLHAHWAELVLGMRAEVFKNLFIGYAFRLQVLLYQKQPNGFENLYYPGFGRKNSGNIGASFEYYISYQIPFKKKKK